MMRLYDYRCVACGEEFEAIVRADEKDAVRCPECGGATERQVNGVARGGEGVAGGTGRCYTGG